MVQLLQTLTQRVQHNQRIIHHQYLIIEIYMIGDNVHGMCLIVAAIGKGISTYWWNANNWDNAA